jgi:hypothetical protein
MEASISTVKLELTKHNTFFNRDAKDLGAPKAGVLVIPRNVTQWRTARYNVHRRVTRAGKEVNLMLSCNPGNVGRNG